MTEKRFDINEFEKVNNVKIRIKGKVLWNDLNNRLKTMYNELSRSVRMKGFRPGRVPRSLLRKMFGKQVEPSIIDEAVKEAVVEYFTDLSKEKGVYYDKNPKNWEIDTKEIENGKDLEFSVELEALEDIKINDYSDLELFKYVVSVQEKEIQKKLEEMVEKSTKEVPVEDGELKEGMIISLKYMGKIGEDPIEIENFTDVEVKTWDKNINRKDAMLLDLLASHLLGKNVTDLTRDEFEAEFDVPESFPAKELASKKARLLVEVSSVRRKEKPELNDEFAKDQGKENLEELKAEVREQLEKEHAKKSEELLERELINKLIEANPIEIGENLLRTQTESLVEGFMSMIGLNLNYLPEEQKQDFLSKYQDMAKRSLLSVVLLESIARQEGIELTDEDIDDYLRYLAESRNESFERIKAEYEKEKDPTTKELALHRKVMKWLLDQANITEKQVEEFPEIDEFVGEKQENASKTEEQETDMSDSKEREQAQETNKSDSNEETSQD